MYCMAICTLEFENVKACRVLAIILPLEDSVINDIRFIRQGKSAKNTRFTKAESESQLWDVW